MSSPRAAAAGAAGGRCKRAGAARRKLTVRATLNVCGTAGDLLGPGKRGRAISFTIDVSPSRTYAQHAGTNPAQGDSMTTRLFRPEDLPDFRRPPLVETVLSIQFQPLQRFSLVHVGLLWHKFRSTFPLIEEHAPLRAVSETFGGPAPGRVEVPTEAEPPLPRVCFLNESKSELIQIQADRFIHSWRKTGAVSTPYPRYERIRTNFRHEVREFHEFLADERLGSVAVDQCEITYVNHIEPCQAWHSHGRIEGVLRNWTGQPRSFLPELEDGSIQQRFVIRSGSDRPLGRLHASLTPAWKSAGKSPILDLTLTARGSPLDEGIDGAFDFFDLGREWIVKGFLDLTTADMHRAWGSTDVGSLVAE